MRIDQNCPMRNGSKNANPGDRLEANEFATPELTLVEIVGPDELFEGGDIDELGAEIKRLTSEGHTRLLLNLRTIRAMSSDVLAVLATASRRLNQQQGWLGVCGLNRCFARCLKSADWIR